MDKERKETLAGLTASYIKKPFSKLKTANQRARTKRDGVQWDKIFGVPNREHSKPSTEHPLEESSISKIMNKLIPSLCTVTKVPPDDCGDFGSQLSTDQSKDEGSVIDVSPPIKKVISGKVARRKNNYPKGPRLKKKIPVDLKAMRFQTVQARFQVGSDLNVKISGAIDNIVRKMAESKIKKIITLSGAGMSTSAGIPDFRSPNSGIYDKLKEYDLPYAQAIFERKYFDKNPKPLYALLKEMLAVDYKPTLAHYFVKLLEEKGLLLRHITQNVDGLERLSGVSQKKVVEAHGSIYGSRCLKCKTEYDLQWLRDRLVIQGKSIPHCQNPRCMGMVKPNIVLFGETLNPRFMASVKNDVPQCDLLIIIGTSLVVEPFASTVKKVSRTCPRIVVNNVPVGEHHGIVYEGSNDPKRKEKKSVLRDVFIQGSCDEGIMYLTQLFEWEGDLEALIKRCEPQHDSPSSSNANRNNDNDLEKERPNGRIMNESKSEKNQAAEKIPDHSSLNGTNVTGTRINQSVANQARRMWKCVTSRMFRTEH